jgi:hypothetical protein
MQDFLDMKTHPSRKRVLRRIALMKKPFNNSIMSRIDGYRAMYFVHWILQQYAMDKRRLQDLSVAEIIEKYDQEQVKK